MLRAIPGPSGVLELVLVEPSSDDFQAPSQQAVIDVINQIQSVVIPPTASVSTLSNLGNGLDSGTWVWVVSRKRFFSLDKSDSGAAVSGERVSAAGGGMWISHNETSSNFWTQKYVAATPCLINPSTGNDDNDGFTLPLLTFAEFARRMPVVMQSNVVSYQGSANPAASRPNLYPGSAMGRR